MQNSQVFFVEFCKHCVEVRKNQGLRDLRAIAPTAFLLLTFTYQGELGGFMQNSTVSFVKFCKHCESTGKRVFSGFKGDRC